MAMQLEESLARKMWAIHDETWPNAAIVWEDMKPYEREAWIQVARFMVQTIQNNVQEASDKYYGTPDHK